MNQYLSKELYNEEFKMRFIESYKEQTQVFYKSVLSKAYDTEIALGENGKDIYEMDNQELDSLLKSYCNGSIDAVSSVHSVLKKYIDFAIAQGYVETKMNYLQGMGGKDFLKYVDQVAHVNKYLTKDELIKIIDECVNAQDALCIAFPFYGIKGEQCEEIVNLKESDVNRISQTLILRTNEGKTRTVQVDEYLINLIDKALDEDEYLKGNGVTDDNVRSRTFKICKTDYILRISAQQTTGSINPTTIVSRVNRIKEYWGNPYLTITSLWYSGMVEMAKQIADENGRELKKDEWIMINEKFGYAEKYWGRTRARYDSVYGDK